VRWPPCLLDGAFFGPAFLDIFLTFMYTCHKRVRTVVLREKTLGQVNFWNVKHEILKACFERRSCAPKIGGDERGLREKRNGIARLRLLETQAL